MSTPDNAEARRSVVEDAFTLLLLDPSHEETQGHVARTDVNDVPDELR
jgi:hypothetical protein